MPIHELFEQQVTCIHPDRVAVSLGRDAALTYAQLERPRQPDSPVKLVALGVGPDQPVGIATERSLDLIVGLLAILKAGGAYLPLDPAHPAERIQLQLADAQAKVVLVPASLPAFSSLVQSLGPSVLALDTDCSAESPDDLTLPITSSHLAYILYTSGSTGRPKGVLIEHKSVVRLVRDNPFIAWSSDDRVLHHSPLAFDASTLEVWGPLLNGAHLVLLPPGPFSLENLTHTIRSARISILWLTASVFHRVADEAPEALASVRQLLAGGEVVSGSRIAKLLIARPDLLITNGYGPTESTTFATTASFSARDRVDDPPPLGRPIANTQVYLLDDQLQPLPVGVPGELCIGGDGLARGYLNQPDLTAQAFVPTPSPAHRATASIAPATAPAGVPTASSSSSAAATARSRSAATALSPARSRPFWQPIRVCSPARWWFKTMRPVRSSWRRMWRWRPGQAAPSVESLRAHLRKTMPDFMLPAVFFVLPSLPITTSGKVDRRALPDLATGVASSAGDFVAPGTELECKVADIWVQTLGVPRVGLRDDFFALGGHSLAALKLITRLRDAGYELDVAELFLHSSLGGMIGALKPIATDTVTMKSDEYVVRLKEGRPWRNAALPVALRLR
jgi:amino acid adenylation domain-containing protein